MLNRHFRTLTAVVEVDETTDLRYPGLAHDAAQKALEAAGFTNVRLRNAPNPTGEMPPAEGLCSNPGIHNPHCTCPGRQVPFCEPCAMGYSCPAHDPRSAATRPNVIEGGDLR